MIELIMSIIVVAVAALACRFAASGFTRLETRAVLIAFVAHGVAAIAQIEIARGVYGGGDNLTYMAEGSLIARAIEIDPERFGRFWLALLLQRETNEALPVLGEQSSTGSMVAIAAALALVLRYSLYASGLAVALASLIGKIALYRVFRELLPLETRTRAQVAVLLMPSVVFWSSGMQKEAIVVAAIGPLWLGVHRLMGARISTGLPLTALGVAFIALVKPYTLFVLVIAAGAWFALNLRRQRRANEPLRIKPLYLVVAAPVVYGLVILLGQIFPAYSVDKLGEDLARHQGQGLATAEAMTTAGGGASGYAMGDEHAGSIQRQLAFAPLAAATALFRPFPFEANNALAGLASLEMLALTTMLLLGLGRRGIRGFGRSLLASPVLLASMLFAVMLGMGVGLATTNFGSLSRYRMPLIPFYATVVLSLSVRVAQQRGQRKGAASLRRPARVPPPLRRHLS